MRQNTFRLRFSEYFIELIDQIWFLFFCCALVKFYLSFLFLLFLVALFEKKVTKKFNQQTRASSLPQMKVLHLLNVQNLILHGVSLSSYIYIYIYIFIIYLSPWKSPDNKNKTEEREQYLINSAHENIQKKSESICLIHFSTMKNQRRLQISLCLSLYIYIYILTYTLP